MTKKTPRTELLLDLFITKVIQKGGEISTLASLGVLRVIQNQDLFKQLYHEAVADTDNYIKTVRSAHDADPNWTDDDIAGQILVEIKAKRAERWPDPLRPVLSVASLDEQASSELPPGE